MAIQKTWEEMNPKERKEFRFQRWLNPPDVKFASFKAEKNYKGRVQRIIDAVNLKEPDRSRLTCRLVFSRPSTPEAASKNPCTVMPKWNVRGGSMFGTLMVIPRPVRRWYCPPKCWR